MIISKILNKFKSKDYYRELAIALAVALTGGLVGGLEEGLVVGLAWVLVVGLACGLAGGLVGGLAWVLVVGLAWGLVVGLAWGLGVSISTISSNYPQSLSIWLLIGIIILLTEIFFFLDNSKPNKKENKLWFTTKRKFYALFDAVLVLAWINNIRVLSKEISVNWDKVLDWIGYIGLGIIILAVTIGIVWVYIYLNSLRYKK